MKNRPRWLSIMTIIFTGIALSFPVQIAFLYGHGLGDLSFIFAKISVLNLLVITVAAVNIRLLWVASPYLKFTMPLILLLVAWNNFVVGSFGGDYTMTTTSLATLGFVALCFPLTQRKLLYLLKNPGHRWWLTPPRIKTQLHAQLHPHVGTNLLAETYDVSESGVYIPLASCKDRRSKDILVDPDFAVGDLTSINIRLSQFKSVKCDAKVVRIANETQSHPAGIGLEFMNLDHHAKRYIREHLRELH